MEIQPNTTIRILQNVPLDVTYKNTIYFASAGNQTSYFSGKTKYTLTEQSYQRVQRGMMRVQLRADNLYNCNYLMFQNTSFGAKWFYAFITGVEYINNEVAEITFELDVMQTWWFDVTLKESFVEREHSKTDVAGDNIVPEPVGFGDYFNDGMKGTGKFDDYGFVVVAPFTFIGSKAEPAYECSEINKNPIAVKHLYYKTISAVTADIASLAENGYDENVLCVYMIPKAFVSGLDNRDSLPKDSVSTTVRFYDSKPTRLGTYIPTNNKLLTYPYSKMTIETFDGDSRDYAYEFFSDYIEFNIHACLTSNVSFKCVPNNYKGVSKNYLESVVLTDFPMVAYTTDAFRAWIAQNKTRLGIQGAGAIFDTFTGLTSGAGNVLAGSQRLTPKTRVISKKGSEQMAKGYTQMGEASIGGVFDIANILSEGLSAKTLGNRVQGSTDGSLEIAMGKKDFNYVHQYINPKDARIIDDFFSMYGYATKQVKVPNRNVRPHWTFTKTVGCNLIGNAPADDVAKICSIYDHGITFWRNGNEVGNYSLDNKPV